MQIEISENFDKKIELLHKNFPEINKEHKDLVDFIQKSLSYFDEVCNQKFIDQIHSYNLNGIMIQKLRNGMIGKIDKKMERMHFDTINKLISYDDNRKYITCSNDETIIIRNCKDNTVIKILTGHKEAVLDILLLSNGRLASASADNIIKIWDLTDGQCKQTCIGHLVVQVIQVLEYGI